MQTRLFKSQNGSLVSRVWTASNCSKVHFSIWLLWMWGRHWIPNSIWNFKLFKQYFAP